MARRLSDTTWFEGPLAFAAAAHSGLTRKDTGDPFIVHPIQVALILQRHGFSRPLVVAALLHDVVEDTHVTLQELRDQFGEPVAALVAAVSEEKRDAAGQRRPWRERKRDALARLEAAPTDAVALKAADALQNAESLAEECERLGPDRVWPNYNATPAEEAWYFRCIVELVVRRLGRHPLALELVEAVDRLLRFTGASATGEELPPPPAIREP